MNNYIYIFNYNTYIKRYRSHHLIYLKHKAKISHIRTLPRQYF